MPVTIMPTTTRRRAHLIALTLTIYTVLINFSADVTSSASIITTAAAVRVGIFGPISGPIAPPMQAVLDGVKASFAAYNEVKGGIQGQPLEITFIPSWEHDEHGNAMYPVGPTIDLLQSDPATKIDCLAFPPGRDLTDEVYAGAVKHGLTIFGPTTAERSDHLIYTQNKVLVVPLPDAEVASLVRYIVLQRHLRRISILTTWNYDLGNDLIPYITTLLAEFGLEIAHVYAVGTPGEDIIATVSKGIGARTQALLFLGLIDYQNAEAMLGILRTMNLADDWVIASPLMTLPLVINAMASQEAGAISSGHIISTLYTPLADDDTFQAGANYVAAYTKLAAQSANYPVGHPFKTVFSPSTLVNGMSVFNSFALMGYLVAQMMISIFESFGDNPINAETIIDRTFSGWLIPADDYVFGPFSKPCTGARKIGCRCSSGARQVHMSYLDDYLNVRSLPDTTYDISLDICLPTNIAIQSPLVQLVATPQVSGMTVDVASLVTAMTSAFVAGDRGGYMNLATSPSSRKGILMQRTYASMADLETLQANRLITLNTGSIFAQSIENSVTNTITAVLDPLYTTPPLHDGVFQERVVHLGPTLEQEIHALASRFAAGGGMSAMTTSADDAFRGRLADACTRSANTFGVAFGAVERVASIAEGLRSAGSGNVLLHGIASEADVEAVGAYLRRNPAATVLVPFHHLALWYDRLVAAVAEPEARARVVFATNLPSWNPAAAQDTTAAGAPARSPLMQAYYDAMAVQDGGAYTPMTLRGFLTQRLVANIVERIPSKLTQDSFLATLYAVSVVVLDAAAYSVGPLSNARCGQSVLERRSVECEINIGARQLWLRSLEAAVSTSPTVASAVVGNLLFSSGTIEYKGLPSEDGLSTLAIVLIACCIGAFFLLAALGAVWFFSSRSHRHAPKDPSKPFTIMFTDVQMSSLLWHTHPTEMGEAVDIHHRIIRNLIKKYDGYEVKTIGDSFMIAFKEADDALEMASMLQQSFLKCKEFTSDIDDAYLNAERARLEEEEIPVPNLSCELKREAYHQLWNGLRVRVGINTGFGTIQRDETTNAYDYYGSVANHAARVESVLHGGQVCFTQGTLEGLKRLKVEVILPDAITDEQGKVPLPPSGIRIALKLGSMEIRGLTKDIVMYQLECVHGRVFPPLRLDQLCDPSKLSTHVRFDDHRVDSGYTPTTRTGESNSTYAPKLGDQPPPRACVETPDPEGAAGNATSAVMRKPSVEEWRNGANSGNADGPSEAAEMQDRSAKYKEVDASVDVYQ